MACGVFGIFIHLYLFRALTLLCGLLQVAEFIFYAWLLAGIPALKNYNVGLLVFLEIILIFYMVVGLATAVGVWTKHRSDILIANSILTTLQIILFFALITVFINHRAEICIPLRQPLHCHLTGRFFAFAPCLIAACKISLLLIFYITHHQTMQALAEGVSAIGRALGRS